MTKPIRLQLSRKKGFNLQEASRAANGLEAVNVARPTMWGNPYAVGEIDERTGGRLDAATAVERFTDALILGRMGLSEERAVRALAGKNLACWCSLGAPCHADVLLKLVNDPIRAVVGS